MNLARTIYSVATIAGLFSIALISVAKACEARWVGQVHNCGSIIQLDDDSYWEVKSFKKYHTFSWKTGDPVDACSEAGILINLAKHHPVRVRIKQISNYEPKDAACRRR